ncbi:MAG TPA: type I-E CRISPR-associated protein Cas5/CasD [Vulgatibacter sp.]|nr:type I-E CRISPR-associated protein Cas5/CasD [Vulgatibacter sp.]
MKTVLLRLEGPLQSWGTQGRFGTRDTEREPSKSGVVGLVAAALGVPRDDDETIRLLGRMPMAVRVDREGRVVSDYHTAGGGTFLGRPYAVYGTKTVPTTRYYLADASFLVGLGTEDDDLADRVAGALENPRWPLFLGRRSCVPSLPVFAGVRTGDPAAVLATIPPAEGSGGRRLRMVVETSEGSARQDVPISFALYGRRHTRRIVSNVWIELPQEKIE